MLVPAGLRNPAGMAVRICQSEPGVRGNSFGTRARSRRIDKSGDHGGSDLSIRIGREDQFDGFHRILHVSVYVSGDTQIDNVFDPLMVSECGLESLGRLLNP